MAGSPRRRLTNEGPSVFMTLLSAGLFLYVGFGLGLVGVSESAVYNASVTALVWGARIVGIGLICVAAMLPFRIAGADLADLALAGLATALCLGVGLVWLVFGDMQGILLLLFGGLNASATGTAWRRVQLLRSIGERPPSDSG